jgi:hypothetical protein
MSTPICTHDWQPIPGWYARYRCSLCEVIGCKFGVVVAKYGAHRSVAIEPYRCQAQCGGARCNEPAVHGWAGKGLRCAAHRPGQAARARRELAAVKKAAQAGALTVTETTAAPSIEGLVDAHV